MRAVVYSELGDSSVLQVVERDLPAPHWGEVRVKLAVAGVNPTDWKFRAGTTAAEMPFDDISPGQDGAGVVDEVGNGVYDVKAGDRVWIFLAQHDRPLGTASEYTVVPAERVVRLPRATSYDVGASLGVPAMTAHRCLTVHEDGPTRLSPEALDGLTVLVTGGAGAVGNAAIRLAAWAGATVITTVSNDEKARLAEAAGADQVVNYKTEDVAASVREIAPSGGDVVGEVSAAKNLPVDFDVLKTNGTISIYTSEGSAPLEVPARP